MDVWAPLDRGLSTRYVTGSTFAPGLSVGNVIKKVQTVKPLLRTENSLFSASAVNLLIDILAMSVLYCRGAMHEYHVRCSLHVVFNSIIEEPDISSPLIATSRHAYEGITSNSCLRQASDSSCHRPTKTSVFQLFQQVHSTKVEINSILVILFLFLST